MPVLHSRQLDRRDGYLLPISDHHETCWIPWRTRSFCRVYIPSELLRVSYGIALFCSSGVDSHTLYYHLSKAQVTEGPRRAIGQRSTTTPAKRAKCVKDGRCYRVRVCSALAALHYHFFFSSCLYRTSGLVISITLPLLPFFWLAQMVPLILASVSFSVKIIVKDLRHSLGRGFLSSSGTDNTRSTFSRSLDDLKRLKTLIQN